MLKGGDPMSSDMDIVSVSQSICFVVSHDCELG